VASQPSSVVEALKGARIVATLPVAGEHSGVHRHMALQQMAALRACGAEVYPFDVTYSHTGDVQAFFDQVTPLAAFKPQLVVGTGSPGQVLRCKTGRITLPDGWFTPNNLFVDHLGLPTILLWDTLIDLITIRADSLVLAESQGGLLARVRDQLDNPLYYHVSLDQQHLDAARQLGILTTPRVRTQLPWTHPNHDRRGDAAMPKDIDVAFTGNLFQGRPPVAADRALDVLNRYRSAVLTRMDGDVNASYWDAMAQSLAEIDPDEARSAGLDHDQTFFWTFLVYDVMRRVITHGRLAALRAANRPVDFYGLPFDSELASLLHGSMTTYRGMADFERELPSVFARAKVTLDLVTAWFPTSVTIKVLNCFAAGGLCLFNAKSAFRAAFGSDAERVMYRDFDEMRAKLDYLLSHDRERTELAAHLRGKILEHCDWVTTVARLVAWVRESHPVG
jgi:hypothetical protein